MLVFSSTFFNEWFLIKVFFFGIDSQCVDQLKLRYRARLVDKKHRIFKIVQTLMYDMEVKGEPLDDGKETIGGKRSRRRQGSTSKEYIIRVHIIL